jgi:hypothetical protein
MDEFTLAAMAAAKSVDSLTKQSQASRSNMSHLVIDVLFQNCG